MIYKLSVRAEQDIDRIDKYTMQKYGIDQSDQYLSEIMKVLNIIVSAPKSGQERNKVKKGIRSLPANKHIIFYKILRNEILIVRVLHQKEDYIKISKQFGA